MPGLSIQQLGDLLQTTLENLPQGEFEVAFKYQSYPICDKWFRKQRRRESSGTAISRRVQLKTNGSARFVQLYEATPNNVVDTMSTIRADWVHAEAKHHYESHEIDMNREPAKLVDLIKSRRVAAYMDIADIIEQKAWQTPPDQNDLKFPLGVPYWINYLPAGTVDYDGSFNGHQALYGDGTTSSTVGGIDGSLAANERWRNFAGTHTGMNQRTIDLLRRAIRRTNFTPPISVRDLYRGPASQVRLYSNQDMADEYERMVNAGGDDRNGDLNPFGGILTFKRIPWIAIPALDDEPYDPIFGVNHAHFYPEVLRDWWMKEDEPIRDRDWRHVYTVGLDSSFQFFCTNKRAAGFALSEAIPA
ncbi:MAG: phage major capsid protein [Phycisphaeraceae bacterium]|nr:phage major capsid protein [Phycisphaeraceae bacterium]